MSRAVAFAATVLCVALLPASGAPAAPKAPPPARGALDWTGVWNRIGGIAFDPATKPGQVDAPPYNARFQARYDEIKRADAAGKPVNDPTANCLPPGMPRVMNMVLPMEIIYRPEQVTIVGEWMGQIRHVFTDGRPHPEEVDTSFNGHSIGHWNKGVLYVDTVAMRGDTVFNALGAPHSAAIHVKEKFWQDGRDSLKIEITVEDPTAFTKPWVVVKGFHREPTWNLIEYVCLENNRNPVGADGVTQVILKTGK